MLYYGWLALINIVALILFRHDKRQAQITGAQRVPEATLLLLLLAGGVVGGALGMFMRPRHKTRKPRFWLMLVAALVLHGYLLYRFVLLVS